MQQRLFKGVSSLVVFSFKYRAIDSRRCVNYLKAGKPSAMGQIKRTFGVSLLYVASELLPKDAAKQEAMDITLGAFRHLWNNRELMRDPVHVKIFLHRYVLDACRQINPGMDKQSALSIIAFAEVARLMKETMQSLPKKFQPFYEMKFMFRNSDDEIALALSIPLEKIDEYCREVRALIGNTPEWG